MSNGTKDILKAEYLNILATVGCFVASLSIMVSMFVYLGGKIDNHTSVTHMEMKDFHKRLCDIESRIK